MQGAQVENGLNLIDRSEYDLIVVLRLDMLFKVAITAWSLDFSKLNVPFRSINDEPQYCTCLVADSIMVFPLEKQTMQRETPTVWLGGRHGLRGDFLEAESKKGFKKRNCSNSSFAVLWAIQWHKKTCPSFGAASLF